MPAPGMMGASPRKASLALLALLAVTLISACSKSAEERARDARERAAENALVARTEIVSTLASPREPGRIIYEKPTDLSYANLRKTRPDLDSAALVHGAPTASEKQRNDGGSR